MDKRLAAFLLEESNLSDSLTLSITHEKIANHMGTAREVVTRMLKYFQQEGMVKLTRGTIEITDEVKLKHLQNHLNTQSYNNKKNCQVFSVQTYQNSFPHR